MNIIDKIIQAVDPRRACEREAWRQQLDLLRSAYDAGGGGRLNYPWHARNESAEFTDRWDRDTIRARARDLERNSDLMNGVLSAFKRNVVGKGFTLQSNIGDTELEGKIEALWQEWTKARNCDVAGTQSFTEMLYMAVERKKVDGGILFIKRFTSGGVLPFKLQAVEVDELAADRQEPKRKGNLVVGGVEYSSVRKPEGYWIRVYSENTFEEAADPEYVSASDVMFYFSKRRPSQLREMSDMAAAMPRIRDTNEFITAVSVKERISACLAVFIKRSLPAAGIGRSSIASVSDKVEYAGKTLSPGMIKELNPGEEIEVVDPKSASGDSSMFLKMQERLISSGQGLSYESVSRDMSESTYSSTRQSGIEDDMTYAEEVELLKQKLMDETYETFVISAVLAGAVSIPDFWQDKRKYMAHNWVASPKRWIDPAKEANADKIALLSGQKTFAQICAEHGRDWQEVIDDIAKSREYAASKGLDLSGAIFGVPAAAKGGDNENENDGKQT